MDDGTSTATISPGPSWAARAFFLLLGAYLLAHAAVRLLLSRSLEFDEAEQLLFTQSLELGYSAQPPLYTWIVWLLTVPLGPSVVALVLVRFALLGALYLLLYRVARRLVSDERVAVVAAFTPLLVPVFAWEAIRMLTHTVLLCVCSLATLLVVLRLREGARTRDYLLLGLCTGLGLLSKYNFALFAIALAAAALSRPAWRERLLDWRMLLSIAVAALLIAPHVGWLALHLDEARHQVLRHSEARPVAGRVMGIARGLGHLGYNLVLGLGVAVGVGLVCLRGTAPRPGPASEERRLVGRWVGVMMVLLVGTVLFGGVRHFYVHWFASLLLVLPVWALARVEWQSLPRGRRGAFVAALALAATAALVPRLGTLCFDFDAGKYKTRDFLYADLAERLRAEGEPPQQAVVFDPLVGGYLRMHFPTMRIDCLRYPMRQGADQLGAVLLVWDATHGDGAPAPLVDHSTRWFGRGEKRSDRFIEPRPCVIKSPTRRLGFRVVRPPEGLARAQP